MSPEMNDVVISCEHLSVAYQDKLALENITFNIHRGQFWGILGPNGSGKTTLLRTMLGLIEPLSGSVRLFGCSPRQLGVLRDKIGYVPQYAQIDFNFPLKVRDMVMLGRSRKMGVGRRPGSDDWRAVDQALAKVEMTDLEERQIGRLSGGQRQRALIARALALEPELLMLDEPTAALDVGATEVFYEWIHHMHQQMKITLLLVSHDVGVVSRYVSAVACLNKRLVAHGLPQEVLGSETLEGMYGCDAMFFRHGDVPHMVVPAPFHDPSHSHP